MEDHHALLQTELDALSIVVRGFTIIDAPPFFEWAGREEREPREEVALVSTLEVLELC